MYDTATLNGIVKGTSINMMNLLKKEFLTLRNTIIEGNNVHSQYLEMLDDHLEETRDSTINQESLTKTWGTHIHNAITQLSTTLTDSIDHLSDISHQGVIDNLNCGTVFTEIGNTLIDKMDTLIAITKTNQGDTTTNTASDDSELIDQLSTLNETANKQTELIEKLIHQQHTTNLINKVQMDILLTGSGLPYPYPESVMDGLIALSKHLEQKQPE